MTFSQKEFQEKFNYKEDFFSMELSGLEGVTDAMPRIKEYYPNTLRLKSKTKKKIMIKIMIKRNSYKISFRTY